MGLAPSCSATAWLTQLCPMEAGLCWAEEVPELQEKAASHREASALLTACHALSEVLQRQLRTKEAQHGSGFLLTWLARSREALGSLWGGCWGSRCQRGLMDQPEHPLGCVGLVCHVCETRRACG